MANEPVRVHELPRTTGVAGTDLAMTVDAPDTVPDEQGVTWDDVAASDPFAFRYVPMVVVDAATYAPGILDPTAHVQALIDALDGARATIFFPDGVYNFASSLDYKLCNLLGAGPTQTDDGPTEGGTALKFAGTHGLYSSTPSNTSPMVSEMSIFGSGPNATNGQILLDFSGMNRPRATNVRLWESDIGMKLALAGGVNSCNYGVFDQVDVLQCTTGVEIGDASDESNSHTFLGGRQWSSTVGTRIHPSTNITFIGTTFEVGANPNEAVRSEGTGITFIGCRFESLYRNLHVLAGAGRHWHFGCVFSSGANVVDDNDPTVVRGDSYFDDAEGTDTPATVTSPNLCVNGAFRYDTDADGIPDGWSTTYSVLGTGFTITTEDGDPDVDTYCKFVNTGATGARIGQQFTCEPGRRISVLFKLRTSDAGTNWRVNAGATTGSTEYRQFLLVDTDGDWHEYRTSFTPTADSFWLTLLRNGSAAGECDITDVMVTAADQPAPSFVPHAVSEDGGTFFGPIDFKESIGDYAPASVLVGRSGFFPTFWYGPNIGVRVNASMTEGWEYAAPFIVGQDQAFDRIGVNVVVAAAAGGVIRLGIREVDPTTGLPGELILDAGTINATILSSTNPQPVTIAQTLRAGGYWLTATSQGAPATQPSISFAPPQGLLIGHVTQVTALANAHGCAITTGVTGALAPTAVFTGVQANAPAVGLRAV